MRFQCLVRVAVAFILCVGAAGAAQPAAALRATAHPAAAPATILSTAPAAAAPSTAAPATAAANSRVSVLTAEQVIQILDETVDWYRTLGTQQQNATQPSDLLILFANRQTADEVVALVFDIARANAELLSSEASTSPSQAPTNGSSPQSLGVQQSEMVAKRESITRDIAEVKQRLAAPGKNKQDLEVKLSELQSELAMADARKNLLDTTADFVTENDAKAASANALKSQIDAIAATVPASGTNPAPSPPAGAPTAAATANKSLNPDDSGKPAPARQGIWELGSNVLRLRNKIATIDVIDQRTAALAAKFQKISAPSREQLKAYSTRSEALASQADHASGEELKVLRDEFDTLAWLFKQTSAILIPLTKEHVLLEQYRHNLSNWKEATLRQYKEALTALGVRLGVLIGILAVVFGLAEVWRRMVLRYAPDARRRSQLLLVRQIVLWTLVIGIVGLNFVTEISSFVTFAGLLTAGIAVAMQSVLVSVVGYFFLIGKYGVRVGDRVQIGTVVGEVIELGLVRMHLMELNTSGPLGPTGRVVAFANLIVFQASGGLFKQIPGVTLSWHEMTLTLPIVSDYAALKDKLLTAVSKVVEEYRDEFVRQNKAIADSTASNILSDAMAQLQMHLTNGRMEALIRYPVSLKHAVEIDERVSEAVLKVIAENTGEGSGPASPK
jgi:small-conductance mechanosensitive channel